MLLLSKNLRDERKKSLNDGAQLTQTLNLQISALDRAKKNYEKAFRDSEKAIENYQKADADFNLSRAEVSFFYCYQLKHKKITNSKKT
jgi:formin-binding protein 1